MSDKVIVEHSSTEVFLFDRSGLFTRPGLPQLKVAVQIMQEVHSTPDADGVRTEADTVVIIVESSNRGADDTGWDDYIPLSVEDAERVAHAMLDAVARVREAHRTGRT